MLLVPWPAVIDQPEGTDQVYVTPETFVTLYVCPAVFWHGEAGPVIAEG
jgi:hypothetical protein